MNNGYVNFINRYTTEYVMRNDDYHDRVVSPKPQLDTRNDQTKDHKLCMAPDYFSEHLQD
jgi:hypothetical protein